MNKKIANLVKHRKLLRVAVGLSSFGAIAAAFFGGRALAAGIPESDVLHYAGTLMAVDGTPIEGAHDVEVQFAATSTGPALCSTNAPNITVTQGRFAVALDDACVDIVSDNENLYVQVVVDSDAFGWSKVGAVPYAVEAGRAAAADQALVADAADSATGELDTRILAAEARLVPQGAVMAFDSAACPSGWSPLASAQGRTIVGLPAGGTLAGTLGTALANLEDRAHTHSVDPAAVTSTSAGAHTHNVDPYSVYASYTSLAHTHSVDPPSTNLPAHRHNWGTYNSSTLTWSTYSANGNYLELVAWTDGMDSAGSGNYPLEHSPANAGANNYYTGTQLDTNGNNTTLAVDITAFTSGTSSSDLNHTHSVDVGNTTSTSNGDHAHDVDVAATVSSSASTSSVIPYVQLLYCKKD